MLLNSTRKKRLALVAGGLAVIGIAAGLIFNAFSQSMVFFFTPTQLMAGEGPKNKALRIGGMVETGSLQRESGTLRIRFKVTDMAQSVPVEYSGIVPDLFREGKGVVASGRFENGVFQAQEILAKHDENYMPPPAQHALDQAKARSNAAPSSPKSY